MKGAYLKKMTNEFGKDKVFSNSREYYDEIYRKENLYQIAEARLERKNDKYYSSLEYISSINSLVVLYLGASK